MRRFITGFLALAMTAGVLAGCGGKESAPSGGSTGGAAQQKIVMDLIPTQGNEKFKEQIDHLGTLLSAESGLDVEMRIQTDYAAVVELMRAGRSDVSYFGPFTYVVANAQSGAEAFVTMNVKGKPYYYSYAIVANDSPIQSMTDAQIADTLKGKNVALGDPNSTSSSQIPQLYMMNAGLDRDKDLKLAFTGGHDAVLKAVANKSVDIGFLDSAIFEQSLKAKFPEDFSKVRVVWQSTELYQYPWAHRKDLDGAVVKKLQDAFLKITDPQALEPFGADAFVLADDAKYDPVRDAAKALGVDLDKYALKK